MSRPDSGERHPLSSPERALLVAARNPRSPTEFVPFHPRLTVIPERDSSTIEWLRSVLDPVLAPDTLVEIDARTVSVADVHELRMVPALRVFDRADLEREGDSPAEQDPSGCDDIDDDFGPFDAERPRRQPLVIESELRKWELVTREAEARLRESHRDAPHAETLELAAAARMRNEWRYALQVHRQERRRRTRRDVELASERYRSYLACFGASSYEDLAVAGTGFGDTSADIAIREAATIVSMAEQHCAALRTELELAGAEPFAPAPGAPLRDPVAIVAALEALTGDDMSAPVVIGDIFTPLDPQTRLSAFDAVVAAAESCQIVLVGAPEQVVEWARALAPSDGRVWEPALDAPPAH